MKQVLYQGSTNIRHHHREFSCPGYWHQGFMWESSQPAQRNGSYYASNNKHYVKVLCVCVCAHVSSYPYHHPVSLS
jgi:hypothetical protein